MAWPAIVWVATAVLIIKILGENWRLRERNKRQGKRLLVAEMRLEGDLREPRFYTCPECDRRTDDIACCYDEEGGE